MKSSDKSPAIEEALQGMFGFDRREAIHENVCVPPPIGCGKPIHDVVTWSEIELAEYKISGLCAECQRKIFTGEEW